jgi:cell division septation protein DedD
MKNVLVPVFGLLLFGLAACGSTPAQRRPAEATYAGSDVVREEFDPQTLNDDDFLLQPTEGLSVPAGPPTPSQTTRKSAREATRGYRIQIAAIIDRVRAERLRSRAEIQLKERVYVAYDDRTRLYKMHVGNCRTAAEAETLRKQTKVKGYPEAFIVRSRIEIAPSPYRLPVESGYRVQIFSATGRDSAERSLNESKSKLGREDIYIEFEPPYFKVRVGNFRSKSDADDFLKTARKNGYDTPFPVKTEILSNPR